MVRRVLLVTFAQALRSLILSLLPITTITLLAWAFAGSQTGNTSDPLRASIWFWLGSHLIPFKLSLAPAYLGTFFNYLPIGAIFLPLISLRNSFKRAVLELENERAARSFLAIWYGLIATLAAASVQSETVKPIIYLAPVYAIAITLLATINLKSDYFKPARYIGFGFLLICGIGAIVISAELLLHFSVVKSIALVVQPGWIGGILLVFLEILYLPNLIMAALSYFGGIGFSIGHQTLVTPLTVKLNGIPALPILGALPSKREELAFLFLLIPFTIFALNLRLIAKGAKPVRETLSDLWRSVWIFIPISIILGYQSGGSFITQSLNPFGIHWWALVTIYIAIQIAVILITYLVPSGVIRLVKRNV